MTKYSEVEERLKAYMTEDDCLDLEGIMIDVIAMLKIGGRTKKDFISHCRTLWDDVQLVHAGKVQ